MTATIQEIYTQFISGLPSAERLQLATLILNNLVQQNAIDIDAAIPGQCKISNM